MDREEVKGKIDQGVGKAKETVGKVTGDAKREGEGKNPAIFHDESADGKEEDEPDDQPYPAAHCPSPVTGTGVARRISSRTLSGAFFTVQRSGSSMSLCPSAGRTSALMSSGRT